MERIPTRKDEHNIAVSLNDSDQEDVVDESDRRLALMETKMMRKFDMYALVPLGVFYLFAALDRSNLGNAQVAGMPEDLGLVGNQFGTAATLLFATYVPFEAPAAMLVKRISPKYLMAVCAFCWGITTLCMAFIQDWRGLYATRMLIGFFESALIPSISVYLALVYRKSQRGIRQAVIFGFSAFSSAFGGVLAYGLTQIKGPNGFSGWRWLFVVEGALTLLFVPIFFFVFPKSPVNAWFLDADQKRLMKLRYEQDLHWGFEEKFTWREVGRAVTDPKFYAFWVYQYCCDISLYGITTFMPEIIRGLGYTSVHANLMTVPVYLTAMVVFFIIAYFSDSTGLRGPFLILPLVSLIIGYCILIAVENLTVRFLACFLAAIGIYPTTGLSLMWLQDNVARHYKRATMVGMTLSLANCAGVTVGQIYTAQTKPRYQQGLSISLGLSCLALVIVIVLMTSMTMVNRARERSIKEANERGRPLESRPELGDYDVHFRYTL